jgi:hypothetical protein
VEYPALQLRISGHLADVIYFPHDGHPGFRCMGGDGLPPGGMTTLLYEGADPGTGEETPNEFILPAESAMLIAEEFRRSQQMSGGFSWFEL